ncbi:hypothetical protein M3175_20920 [Robertmurraya korlensis]|uniref:hypothetical protein n=1 Tax=Robertmurraya korlensis TaxID=519977 RepID=UPI00204231BB|nr:hypothetical protein [Robertmurraya korlensis]MCM3603205.1 hypothetical protein [Robertmurraya korlensis]
MRYYIDFGWVFLSCIIFMIFSKVWTILGNYPEAFKYGSIIYQVVDVILFVLANLSIGIAATIVFYYIQQLVDKKKNFEVYTELRRILLFMFYRHLVVLSQLDNFKEIRNIERRLPLSNFMAYNIFDIPILIDSYRSISTNEEREIFKNNLMNYFGTMTDDQLESFVGSFEKQINEIFDKENIRYFKESKDLIASVYVLYNDDFSIIQRIYIKDKDNNKEELLSEIVKDYMSFLDASIELYEELDIFIESIEKKKIFTFIKMLD